MGKNWFFDLFKLLKYLNQNNIYKTQTTQNYIKEVQTSHLHIYPQKMR